LIGQELENSKIDFRKIGEPGDRAESEATVSDTKDTDSLLTDEGKSTLRELERMREQAFFSFPPVKEIAEKDDMSKAKNNPLLTDDLNF
jgi:hypothetical protein